MSTREFSREDILALLSSIGVVLPPRTKIPDEELLKRLSYALDAAQQVHAVFDASKSIVPSDYPKWTLTSKLLKSTERGNHKEAMENRLKIGPSGVSSAKEHTFREMRQVVMSFANEWHSGRRDLCLMDKERRWGVYIRLLDVYKVNDETPLFVVAFKEIHATEGRHLIDILQRLSEGEAIVSVQTTELERFGMLKLLRHNSKRLSSDASTRESVRMHDLKTTFAVPLGPITMRDMGKLTNDTGCELCGKTKVSRCVQCLSVAYCGKECQKEDWSNHKTTCRSLKGGTWHTVNFEKPESKNPGVRAVFSRHDPIPAGDKTKFVDFLENGVPVNIHNDKTFLVKMQIAFFPVGEKANMLIYDRQKSFQVFWLRRDNPGLFDDAEEMMGDKLKIYRYAKRSGDYQLNICLDRPPSHDPGW